MSQPCKQALTIASHRTAPCIIRTPTHSLTVACAHRPMQHIEHQLLRRGRPAAAGARPHPAHQVAVRGVRAALCAVGVVEAAIAAGTLWALAAALRGWDGGVCVGGEDKGE